MTACSTTCKSRPLRAPSEDGGVLIEPDPARCGELLAHNRSLQARHDECELGGRSLSKLRAEARAALLADARAYTAAYRDVPPPASGDTLLLAGHQPELFHPGVWAKNFVLSGLAQRFGGTAVNLVIDNDTARLPGVRVPSGTADRPMVQFVPLDGPAPELPYEQRGIVDGQVFRAFGARTCRHLAALVPDALVCHFWSTAVQRGEATGNLGAAVAQARHAWEGRWGLHTLELPWSRVCDSTPFSWFAAHLLAHLPRFWDVHNAALDEYRCLHRLRSATHPVPALAAEGPWLEAPFWVWRRDDPQRRRLFARQADDHLHLTDRAAWQVRIPCAPEAPLDRTVDALAALAVAGVKIRSRALTTTLYARLVLGDLFVHGIGGAKYDELTDVLWRRFFGLPPLGFLTVSATLRLPVAVPRVSPDQLRSVDEQLRRLTFQPERFLDRAAIDPRIADWIAQKQRWIEAPPDPQMGRARFRALRAINEQLQGAVAARRAALQQHRDMLAAQLRAWQILSWREYAFVLHPAERLRRFLLALRDAAQ
jgi:hypothetical protein